MPAKGQKGCGTARRHRKRGRGTGCRKTEGRPDDLADALISGSAPTIYGWMGGSNTRSDPDRTYTLESVASYAGGVTGTSSPVTITVAN